MGKKHVILLILLSFIIAAADICVAATIRVTEGNGNIQTAVDRSLPGDLILINKGRYVENIAIDKAIHLRAASYDAKVVVAAKDTTLPVIKVEGTIGASIDGINTEGSTEEAGILLLHSSKITVSRSSASKNRIGIAVVDSESNTISENRTEFNETYGIYLERSSGNTVVGNIAGQNSDKGIFLSYADNNDIRENSTNHNTWNGILLWDSNDNNITDNEAYRNMYGLIESESSGNIYEDNSTLPNLYIILPIIMIYTGVIFYLLQRLIVRRALILLGKEK